MTTNRRIQIFFVGLAPILTLCVILFMATKFGLNVFTLMTSVDKRDAGNFVIQTKVLGVVVSSRPATQEDLNKDDNAHRTIKVVILSGSFFIIGAASLMCFASITGKPTQYLEWCDRNLGSLSAAIPTLSRQA